MSRFTEACQKCRAKETSHRSGLCGPCRTRECKEPDCQEMFTPVKAGIERCVKHQNNYRMRMFSLRRAYA